MDEHDVIRTLRRFPDDIASKTSIKSRRWKCSDCGAIYVTGEPVTMPVPCKSCGSIFFETV